MADIDYRSSSYGDEYDDEVQQIQTRREMNFGLRFGMNAPQQHRKAADDQHAADIRRLHEIELIRRVRSSRIRRVWQVWLCWSGLHHGRWIPIPYCVKCPHCERTWAVI